MHQTFYSSQANSFLERFATVQQDLRYVSEPSARQMLVSELVSIYYEAKDFYEEFSDELNHISQHQLIHLLSRDVKQHIVLSKSSDNQNLISNHG